MSISNDLLTLAQVSSEVEESEVKLIFANQCIKAQGALAIKLREEIQRRKEICNIKKNENHKLEAEIKNAELEIENIRITYSTIKSVNTEMRKDFLLAKEKKSEIEQRIKRGEKKYEDIWVQCKNRYENIPLVKQLKQDKNKCEDLKIEITALENEAQMLEKQMKEKKKILEEKTKNKIILLAEFFVKEVPTALETIKKKTAIINKLTKELDDIEREANRQKVIEQEAVSAATEPLIENGNAKSKKNWSIDNSPIIPKLQLPSVDMDVINFKLDINKVTLHTSPIKRNVSSTDLEKQFTKKPKTDDNLKDNYISCYFNKTSTDEENGKQDSSTINYSKKKLVNIIEDIHIDDGETYKLMAQANIDTFKEVDVITASKKAKEFIKSAKTLEIEEIKDDEMPTKQDVLLSPPTQFLDLTQEKNKAYVQKEVQVITQVDQGEKPHTTKNLSQEVQKKRVSFDILVTNPEMVTSCEDNILLDDKEDGNPNETVTSQLDLSAVTDDNYLAIKDMILNKNQLDLSPQFVYARNTLNKRNEEVIKSKFFEEAKQSTTVSNEMNCRNDIEQKDINEDIKENKNTDDSPMNDNLASMDVDNAVSSPKQNNNLDKPVAGLLFTHGPLGLPDSLDVSMSTTGYEEGDPEFPTCLDSSVLLSPKAYAPMPLSGNNSEMGSQDLPNFLAGFRKGAISFFKQQPSDADLDNNKQNQDNNFNFNFGADDKKSRGGIFSFFR